MQQITPIRILVENRRNQTIANGIFADLVREAAVKVVMSSDASSAISRAEWWLLSEAATLPVTLILDCDSSPEEFRQPVERILNRDAPRDRWHVALAIPSMVDWLERDGQFAAALREETTKRGNMEKYDIPVFFEQWSAQHTFNRDELSAQEPEFRLLLGFITRRCHPAATA